MGKTKTKKIKIPTTYDFFFPLCFSWLSMSVSVLSTAVNVLISEPFVSCVSVVELKVDVALLL